MLCPGPSIHDIHQRLRQQQYPAPDPSAVIHTVAAALHDQLGRVATGAELDLASRNTGPSQQTAATATPTDGEPSPAKRPDPGVLHRTDSRPHRANEEQPRRIVVRRDQRRGRKRNGKSNSDPPR